MSNDSPYADWRVFLLKGFLIFIKPFSPLSRVLKRIVLSIAPNVPDELRRTAGIQQHKIFYLSIYLITTFFCFFLTMGLCAVEGTLFGSDPSIRYFFQDGWNILLYSLVCPAYITIGVAIIKNTITHWAELVDYADEKSIEDERHRSLFRLPFVVFLALLICTGFITNYMYDVLHPTAEVAARARIYWFMSDAGNEVRTLNRVGYYYVVMNFSLLLISLLAASCFISLAVEVIRLGNAGSLEKIDSFPVLQAKLDSFTNAYLLTKGIAAAYAVNIIVWAVSPLGDTSNLLVSQIALSIVGVFFVAIPRQYVELKWYELWDSSGQDFRYSDTRTWKVKATASLLDAFFISAILSTWGFDLIGISNWVSDTFTQ